MKTFRDLQTARNYDRDEVLNILTPLTININRTNYGMILSEWGRHFGAKLSACHVSSGSRPKYVSCFSKSIFIFR